MEAGYTYESLSARLPIRRLTTLREYEAAAAMLTYLERRRPLTEGQLRYAADLMAQLDAADDAPWPKDHGFRADKDLHGFPG
jgi:hypothetical protein